MITVIISNINTCQTETTGYTKHAHTLCLCLKWIADELQLYALYMTEINYKLTNVLHRLHFYFCLTLMLPLAQDTQGKDVHTVFSSNRIIYVWITN